ncbi:uncharacterized protein LOC144865640 isoform X1 [Branchiostoma floridae x Branchiostoma japonicum]
MSRQQEFICGLSCEVTISVLPRLNMEELMFELNRRIQNLDEENSIKDRLVSILRDVMLEEYRQMENRSVAKDGFPNQTIGPAHEYEQETETMQENGLTEYTETGPTNMLGPDDASQQSSGPDSVINIENSDASGEMQILTNEPESNTDQIQLTVSQHKQLFDTPIPGPAALPCYDTSLTQKNATADSRIKEEEFATTTEEDTSTLRSQLLDTINPWSNFYTEKPLERHQTYEETQLASCQSITDHSGVHIKLEPHVSEDDQIDLISQLSNLDHPEHYVDDRGTGFSNGGPEERGKDSIYLKEAPLVSCEPTPEQEPLIPDNDDSKHYVCDVCGFQTPSAQKLSKHRQRHKGEKPFMCGECGYRAYHRCWLDEHMRTHTGEKTFNCNHCDYKASCKRNLVDHIMMTHMKQTDAKHYRCEICGYQSDRYSHIETHMMRHAGVKPYKCEICDYRTTYKGDLVKHRRRHTGERPYSCKECDYKATVQSSLITHIRKKHQRNSQLKTRNNT